jgi:hypothetical protein
MCPDLIFLRPLSCGYSPDDFRGHCGGAPRGLTLEFTRVVVLYGEEERPEDLRRLLNHFRSLGAATIQPLLFPY